jgi:hypothetical protein
MHYAIYYVPRGGTPLAEFGAGVLGHDLERGEAQQRLALPGIPEERLAAATRRAPRYGFHATIKAPFRLAQSYSRIDVLRIAADVADRCRPALVPALEVARLGNFIALRPQGPSAELDAMAASFVRGLDELRAVEERDHAKWPPGKLSARQEELLQAWGYPYVLDQYRFHMTLTDGLGAGEAGLFMDGLKAAAAPVTGKPVAIDAVSVVEESAPDAPFKAIARFHLRGVRLG